MIQGRCHILIANTAKGIAGAFYDGAASDDTFYKMHPSGRSFVRAKWRFFIQPARETLAKMLASPATTEHVKQEIYEALLKDWALQGKDVQAIH